MKKEMVTNEMNRYLFYDNEMRVFAFKKGERKKKYFYQQTIFILNLEIKNLYLFIKKF